MWLAGSVGPSVHVFMYLPDSAVKQAVCTTFKVVGQLQEYS